MRDVKFYITRACNAKCDFCFAKCEKDLGEENFKSDLEKLRGITEEFTLNITGGEPGLFMDRVEALIRAAKSMPNCKKIVLTTNGTALKSKSALGLIDHVNLSLHSFKIVKGVRVFYKNKSITGIDIQPDLIYNFAEENKNLSIQMVRDTIPKVEKVAKLAIKAKELRAKSLRLRLNYELFEKKPDLSLCEISEYIDTVSECDVCLMATLKNFELPVSIHWGVMEPSSVPGYETSEYVINGGMTFDYARKLSFVVSSKATIIASHCGGKSGC